MNALIYHNIAKRLNKTDHVKSAIKAFCQIRMENVSKLKSQSRIVLNTSLLTTKESSIQNGLMDAKLDAKNASKATNSMSTNGNV